MCVCVHSEVLNVRTAVIIEKQQKVQSTCSEAVGEKIKSQSAVTSTKCLLCAADAHFKTLMKFFPLVWFSICLACTTAWSFEFFLFYFPLYLPFIPFKKKKPPCRYVFCLKAGTSRQAIHHVWMCSDTSSSHSLISLGKMGVWHVYILFPFLCCIKNSQPPFCFPPRCKLDISLKENRCWPVSYT